MPGVLPEGLPGYEAVSALLGKLAARLRLLEAQSSDPLLPAVAVAGSDGTTTAASDTPMWRIFDTGRHDRIVTVSVLVGLSDPTQSAAVGLLSAGGMVLSETLVGDGDVAVLAARTPTSGPYVVTGRTSGGTLSVDVLGASAPLWVDDADETS